MPKISELPDGGGITDDDYLLIVDDADGTPVSKRVTAPDAKTYFQDGGVLPSPPLLTSNLNGAFRSLYWVTAPNTGTMNCDAQKPKGNLAFVPAATPATVTVEVTAAQTSAEIYVSLHEMRASDGMPGALVASWGPFDAATTGIRTLSGQVTAIPETNWYWVMQWATISNAGCRSFTGNSMSQLWLPSAWGTAVPIGVAYSTNVGSTTPVDLSAQNPIIMSGNGGIVRVGITE